jgi:hypothetical protein
MLDFLAPWFRWVVTTCLPAKNEGFDPQALTRNCLQAINPIVLKVLNSKSFDEFVKRLLNKAEPRNHSYLLEIIRLSLANIVRRSKLDLAMRYKLKFPFFSFL